MKNQVRKKRKAARKPRPKLPRFTRKDEVTAVYLSRLYRRSLAAFSLYARPWRFDLDITTQPVFKNFVNLARLVRGLEADPRAYIKAQFEYWEPWKRFQYPIPSVLCSELSVARYNQWLVEHGTKAPTKKEKLKEASATRLRRDKMRLKIYRDRGGGSDYEILTYDPTAFSRSFLESHGVWDEVKDIWLEWASNA